MPQNANITIYSNGRACGYVRADHCFYRKISGKQVLQRPPALALAWDVINQLKSGGAVSIQIENTDTGTTYKAALSRFLEAGFDFERGFGKQHGLQLPFWIREARGEAAQLELFPARA